MNKLTKMIEIVGWGTMNEPCFFCGEPSSHVYIDGIPHGSYEGMEPCCNSCLEKSDITDQIADILNKIFPG